MCRAPDDCGCPSCQEEGMERAMVAERIRRAKEKALMEPDELESALECAALNAVEREKRMPLAEVVDLMEYRNSRLGNLLPTS